MSFVTPWLAWVAAALPLFVLALYRFDRARRRQLHARLGELPVIQKVIASASPRRRALKAWLVALAAACAALAAARPQIVGTRQLEIRGLDLVVAVDVSKSMLVDDVGPTRETQQKAQPPSRLARARELAIAVIDALPGDRIAPIVFAGAASHFPLTEDHLVAANFLRDLSPWDLPQGSNLGEVLRVGRCLLRPDLYDSLGCARIGRRGHGGDPLHGESLDPRPVRGAKKDDDVVEQRTERGKAILVLTDGGDASDEVRREVIAARELGIAVFFVGHGTTAGGLVHDLDTVRKTIIAAPKRLTDGSTVVSRRDDAGMKALAALSGDPRRYLVAPEHGEVAAAPILDAMRDITRGLSTRRVRDRRDIYQAFLFAAFMLLVIESAIGTRRRQRYPEAA